MQCRTHPTTPAFNTCNQCGDWLCEGCTVDIQGRQFCRGCLAKLAAPEGAPYPVAPLSGPGRRNISWGLLFFFSMFFPSGVNYLFMGLIKRGLAAMCGFFLIIYFIGVSDWPLVVLFSLALPIYFLTCIFDGFHIRRRINAGEVVGDNIDGVICFLRRNKIVGWIVLALVGFSVISIVLNVFLSLVSWLLPGLIIVFGLYLLLRRKSPPSPPAE